MTDAKRPLPTLRFVIYAAIPIRLIPQTTPKGRVLPSLWAIPGGGIKNTEQVVALCLANRWRWEIIGNDGTKKRGRQPT